ncbi:UV-B-induced protein-like, chloroplastic [Iris pallida]|uniref:UV-B-induced protein-like, chloroplastic n=1 Tax=Iris pallida TaxID=29817 RepID=A0AAX6F355_IRIPA|nr:UV-B-induced protein-like, chloroplastic [Iris pallida]
MLWSSKSLWKLMFHWSPLYLHHDPSGRVDVSSSGDDKLRMLHSLEAYEMINSHLSRILGQRLDDGNAIAPISKLRVGQVYAASIMYGYFLKRVDQRFQLEKSMKILPWGTKDQDASIEQSIPDESRPFVGKSHPEAEAPSRSSWC